MAEPVLKVKRVRSRGVQKSLISDTTDGPVGIYSQAAHSTVICDGFRVRVKASFVLISFFPREPDSLCSLLVFICSGTLLEGVLDFLLRLIQMISSSDPGVDQLLLRSVKSPLWWSPYKFANLFSCL